MLRLDTGGSPGAGPGAVHGPGATGRHGRHPGVAVLLFQEPAALAVGLPGARPVHSADEAQKHLAVAGGRGPDHSSRDGVLPEGI